MLLAQVPQSFADTFDVVNDVCHGFPFRRGRRPVAQLTRPVLFCTTAPARTDEECGTRKWYSRALFRNVLHSQPMGLGRVCYLCIHTTNIWGNAQLLNFFTVHLA